MKNAYVAVASACAFALFTAGCSGTSHSFEGDSVAGTYTGSYSGSDNGSVIFTVATGGSMQLTAQSAFWKTTLTGTGQVAADETLTGTGNGNLVWITFVGTVANGGASGSWTSANGAKGTWSAVHE